MERKLMSVLFLLCCCLPMIVACSDGDDAVDELDRFLANYEGTWKSEDGDFLISMTSTSAEMVDGEMSYSLMRGVDFSTSGDIWIRYQTFSADVVYTINVEQMIADDEMDVSVSRTLDAGSDDSVSTTRRMTLHKISD